MLILENHLREEGPQSDWRGVEDAVFFLLGDIDADFLGDCVDVLFTEQVGEGKTLVA